MAATCNMFQWMVESVKHDILKTGFVSFGTLNYLTLDPGKSTGHFGSIQSLATERYPNIIVIFD